MEYKLSSPSCANDWANDPFYTSAIVLGIDIGIEGIGVWLRKGRPYIYARTFRFQTPEAAPLRGRRLLRGGRRCRQSERHRQSRLKHFCADFDLPWTDLQDKKDGDGPFKLRLRAVRSKLASKEALVVCLRHIIRHRGYDYHETDEGSFPWGDELKANVATSWARAAYCSPEDAAQILHEVSDCGWKDNQLTFFRQALDAPSSAISRELRPRWKNTSRRAKTTFAFLPADIISLAALFGNTWKESAGTIPGFLAANRDCPRR